MSGPDIIANLSFGVLKGFMYRIPNSAMSSNDAFEIVGILSPQAWDTIIAYSDVKTNTGSNFDFDKSFVIFPHVY